MCGGGGVGRGVRGGHGGEACVWAVVRWAPVRCVRVGGGDGMKRVSVCAWGGDGGEACVRSVRGGLYGQAGWLAAS